MLWFALSLRALPLEALVDGDAKTSSATPERGAASGNDVAASGNDIGPRVVVDAHRRVVIADPVAYQLGVRVGASFAAAAALIPSLVALPRRPEREVERVQQLGMALTRYTPTVVLQGPPGSAEPANIVLLEVQATLRLFGGQRDLAAMIRRTCSDCGIYDIGFASAPTPGGAALLAQLAGYIKGPNHQKTKAVPPKTSTTASTNLHKKLNQLPLRPALEAWHQPRTIVELLEGVGCRSLGEVRALPRAGLARRGGAHLLERIARAYGDEPDPQRAIDLPQHFEQTVELMQRAESASVLLLAAKRLVLALVGWLTHRWLAVSRLQLRLEHETSLRRHHPNTVVDLALGDPTRNPDQLVLLLRERLERLELPAPVYGLRLILTEALAHEGHAGALWRDLGSHTQGERALIDRLGARLGLDRVQRPVLQDDHRPERAQRWVSAVAAPVAPITAPPTPAPAATPMPAWLLAEPQRLPEVDHRPWHRGAALVVVGRAQRIEAGWFDGVATRRDYHLAVGADDRRCYWIYREHAPGHAARWFLHGLFG